MIASSSLVVLTMALEEEGAMGESMRSFAFLFFLAKQLGTSTTIKLKKW
jgi:hypothetical protein